MKLEYFIARRYFFSRKKKSFINVISIISMVVLALSTMALIIVLSVFNGLEGLLRSLHSTVDPDLVIVPSAGKSLKTRLEVINLLEQTAGIKGYTEVIEDNALIKYHNAQRVVRVKGVTDYFLKDDRFINAIVSGEFILQDDDVQYAILGQGVQYDLSISTMNEFQALQVYYPDNQIGPNALNPDRLYRVKSILPGAIFAVEKYYDENLVIVPISFTEGLFDYTGKRTAIEIQLEKGQQPNHMKAELSRALGAAYLVKTNEDLHQDLYRILRIEKLFVFIIFSVIMAIASINIFFSLTMLTIDKKKDVAILAAQGATSQLIRRIFFFEGMIVAFTGAFTGLVLGLLVCFAQQYFGFITTGTQTTIVQAYPVSVQLLDVLYTAGSIIAITLLATLQPAYAAAKVVSMRELH